MGCWNDAIIDDYQGYIAMVQPEDSHNQSHILDFKYDNLQHNEK